MIDLRMAAVGAVAGLIARAILPGTRSLGVVLAALLGIAGALLAGWVGNVVGWYPTQGAAGFVAAVVGAVVSLGIVALVKRVSSSR